MFSMMQIKLPDDSDDDICEYSFPTCGRLILNTIHGQIIIDVRANDVNSFVFEDGKRVNHLLLNYNAKLRRSP